MNSLNQRGNKHIASLNVDLGKMEAGDAGPSIQGESSYVQEVMLPMTPDYRPDHNYARSSGAADRRLRFYGQEGDGYCR
jgi:hypothetical protein